MHAFGKLVFVTLMAGALTACGSKDRSNDDAYRTEVVEDGVTLIHGRLENGLRYAVVDNTEGQDEEAVLRFRVDVGKLDETDAQDGFVHFIEHMAFNGSENYPEGELVPLLEREGLAFGPDTNAYVTPNDTVYALNLPDPEKIPLGFGIFREFADKLTFNAEAVDRERGVLIDEWNVRDTPSLAQADALQEFIFPGSRIARRLRDDPEVIKAVSADDLKAFYQERYRPDAMIVVAVGAFDAQDVEAELREAFASIPKRNNEVEGPGVEDVPLEGAEPAYGVFARSGLTNHIAIYGFHSTAEEAKEPDEDGQAQDDKAFLLNMARAMLRTRFQRMALVGDSPLLGGGGFSGPWYNDVKTSAMGVQFTDGAQEQAIEMVGREWVRVLRDDFTQIEFDRQLASERTLNEARSDADNSRTHASIAQGLLSQLAGEEALELPKRSDTDREERLERATLESVNAAFRRSVADAPPRAFLTTEKPFDRDRFQMLMEEALSSDPPAYVPPEDAVFAYSSFGESGSIVSQTEGLDGGFVSFTFENGVVLNVHESDDQPNVVRVVVSFDGGLLSLTGDQDQGLVSFAPAAVIRGGLGKHEFADIQQLLQSRSIGFQFSVGSGTHQFVGGATKKDFPFLMQILAAYTLDPAFRPDAADVFKKYALADLARVRGEPFALLNFALSDIWVHDPRFKAILDEEAYAGLDAGDIAAWIRPSLAQAPLEIGVSGDIDAELVKDLVASSFGALPARRPVTVSVGEDSLTPARDLNRSMRHEGADDAAAVALAWPAPFRRDVTTAVETQMVTQLLSLQMNRELRERQGEAYVANASLRLDAELPNSGAIFAMASTAADNTDNAIGVIESIAKDLVEAPVSLEELEQAREPLLTALDRQWRNNLFWATLLSRASRLEDYLESVSDEAELLKSLDAEAVRRRAAEIFDPEARSTIVVSPADADPVN